MTLDITVKCTGEADCDDSHAVACEAGSCVCPAEEIQCGARCVDTGYDENHCGGCGTACAFDVPCIEGLCGCDDGEMVIKFSHVVAATGHPKGDAATMLAERVNNEMNGIA